MSYMFSRKLPKKNWNVDLKSLILVYWACILSDRIWTKCRLMCLFSMWFHCLFTFWPAHRAGLLWLNFFGQSGSVSKFPPFLCVKLWVGWVGRGYIELSRYFPALWINRVTLVTKIKTLVFIGILDHLWITKNAFMVCFFASRSLPQFVQYTIPPPAASLIGWLFILGNTDCNTVPTWWM